MTESAVARTGDEYGWAGLASAVRLAARFVADDDRDAPSATVIIGHKPAHVVTIGHKPARAGR
ncbi:MAG: hypothetical protein QM655_12720 [Nocardioidaceae bacterium]